MANAGKDTNGELLCILPVCYVILTPLSLRLSIRKLLNHATCGPIPLTLLGPLSSSRLLSRLGWTASTYVLLSDISAVKLAYVVTGRFRRGSGGYGHRSRYW